MIRFIIILILIQYGCRSIVDATKFRAEKMTYIYEKALQKLEDRKRLGKLETELEKFDKLYMDTKAKDGDGHDVRKDFAQIDEKLRAILEKYELAPVLDAFKMKRKLRNEHEMANSNLVLASEKFTDPKLQKLWDGAQIAKFGQEELIALHADLKEAERKIAEYHDALQDFNKIPHPNSIHLDGEEDVMEKKNRRLKETHKKMSDHLDEVHERVTNEKYSPFEDPKVKKLWMTAQSNANLTAHDLEILQQELLHFEQQIKKLNFHKEELEAVRELSEHKSKGKAQNLEHGELEAKHERMNRKLKKLENYIENKVRHGEL